MEITEIRIKLTEDPRNKLKAYCSVTFDDCFVVRDLKIIDGVKGPFVAMPSRKLCDHCPRCKGKNHLRAGYCNDCGTKLPPDRAGRDPRGRARLHADLAHPIHSQYRIELHKAIVKAYAEEVERSKQEGYQPVSFDDLDEIEDFLDEAYLEELAKRDAERQAGARRPARPGEASAEAGA
ncbi:MAG: SpoVG family protein [Planctomycetes bacterium]|nr:SpoVG family protein [Planctomycetota bacterium]